MRKSISSLVLFTLFSILITSAVSAHPGNTASDGCHYCRTNCDKWGEAWDERHCHGGGSAFVEQPVQQVQQQPVVKQPTPYLTRRLIIPTRKSSIKPTRTPTQTIEHRTNKNTYKTIPINKKNGFWGWIISIISNN